MGKTAKKRGRKKDKREKDRHGKGQGPKKSRHNTSAPMTELEDAGQTAIATHGSSTPVAPTSVVDFWFDPISPSAWHKSRWLPVVQELRPVKNVWHVLSMSVIGDGADTTEDFQAQ